MKDRVDKSMGIVTHIPETLTRIIPTESLRFVFVYYESIKRGVKRRHIYEYR
jgi:hypothetical protein